MKRKIAAAIAKLGEFVIVTAGQESATIRASLQPATSSERDLAGTGGIGFSAVYTLYTPHGSNTALVKTGSRIVAGRKSFLIEKTSDFRSGGQDLFRTARLRLLKEEDNGNTAHPSEP